MAEKKTIRIKWIRSGIGFPHRQKAIVRRLGLKKLNQTVVRPDTPQIRGVVAAVPHLLVIVPEPVAPAWASIPEYTVKPAEAAPADPSATATEPALEPAGVSSTSETPETTNSPATSGANQSSAPASATSESSEEQV